MGSLKRNFIAARVCSPSRINTGCRCDIDLSPGMALCIYIVSLRESICGYLLPAPPCRGLSFSANASRKASVQASLNHPAASVHPMGSFRCVQIYRVCLQECSSYPHALLPPWIFCWGLPNFWQNLALEILDRASRLLLKYFKYFFLELRRLGSIWV